MNCNLEIGYLIMYNKHKTVTCVRMIDDDR